MEKLGNLYQAADRVETVYHLYSDNQDRPQELVSEPGGSPVSALGQEPGAVSAQESFRCYLYFRHRRRHHRRRHFRPDNVPKL